MYYTMYHTIYYTMYSMYHTIYYAMYYTMYSMLSLYSLHNVSQCALHYVSHYLLHNVFLTEMMYALPYSKLYLITCVSYGKSR